MCYRQVTRGQEKEQICQHSTLYVQCFFDVLPVNLGFHNVQLEVQFVVI
jgi:hypothetical protein